MLTLKVLEGDEERRCFISRQALPAQVSDDGALLRDVPGTVLHVPPDHIEFGFAFVHRPS
ncbi:MULTISPECIES: hypothetical protein [Methylobacterium]|uniref:hypothetical protein n=1 Tax=Methylobacterium TaxID=407 RepID=UPI0013EB7121|nr:hypothetical protein [Methylobacterium sp. DB0501]NGM38238.1 hypothetical protein [Methylobacterium sp. DB0501]